MACVIFENKTGKIEILHTIQGTYPMRIILLVLMILCKNNSKCIYIIGMLCVSCVILVIWYNLEERPLDMSPDMS